MMDEDYSDRLGEWRLTETMLGAAMRKPELAQTLIACGFGADDIEHTTHRQIWSTLEKLHRAGKLADHRVVEAALLDDGLGKDDAAAFIEACMRDSENPESPQLAAYVEGVKRRVAMRRIAKLGRAITAKTSVHDASAAEIVSWATAELSTILRGTVVLNAVSGDEAYRLAMLRYTRPPGERTYVPTGIPAIDDHIGGAPRGGATIFAAQKKAGKTTLATRTALVVAPSEPVLYISAEGDHEEIIDLAAQMQAGVRAPKDAREATAAMRAAHDRAAAINSRLDFQWEHMIAPTAEEVAATIFAHLNKRPDLGLVIFDHIKEIRNSTTDGNEETRNAHKARVLDACVKRSKQIAQARGHLGPAFIFCSQMKKGDDVDPVPDTQEWARRAVVITRMTGDPTHEDENIRNMRKFEVTLSRLPGGGAVSHFRYQPACHRLLNTDEGGMPVGDQWEPLGHAGWDDA